MLTTIICVILTMGYVLLMLAYSVGWVRQKTFELPLNYKPATFISVIIPARNESANIAACIESVLAQEYPQGLFEVIVVDDHSEDNTADIAGRYAERNVRCIRLAEQLKGDKINSYKKAAIAAGIAVAKGTLIITTDADCVAPDTWLMNMAAIYEQQNPVMIVAPVIYSVEHNNVVELFQLIDFMSMQGITAAAHALKLGNMSNGANFAFSKEAYQAVGGYEGIDHLASGDDLLLMMKVNKLFPDRIAYLKSQDATVSTTPQPSWDSFLQQRIRWASKSGKYNDPRLTGVLLLVYLFNLSLLVLGIAGNFDHAYLRLAGGMFVVKIVVEFLFLLPVARFFRTRWVLPSFPFLQPLHVLYIVTAGFLGFFGGYKWKGRSVK